MKNEFDKLMLDVAEAKMLMEELTLEESVAVVEYLSAGEKTISAREALVAAEDHEGKSNRAYAEIKNSRYKACSNYVALKHKLGD